jgi:ankyrin repeat protein
MERVETYFALVREGNLEAIKRAIASRRIYGSEIDIDGYSALHEAAKYGQVKIMQWLLGENILTVNEQSEGGNTALHIAAEYGQLNSIQFLIANNADEECTNHMGETFLDIISEHYPHLSDHLKMNDEYVIR